MVRTMDGLYRFDGAVNTVLPYIKKEAILHGSGFGLADWLCPPAGSTEK